MLIVANWKMYLSLSESERLAEKIANDRVRTKGLDLVVCPSHTALEEVGERLQGTRIALGAQNIFWMEQGPYTGEVSPGHLRELGVKYVILGHSERRQYCGETDDMVNKKLHAALAVGMTPILCVGETKAARVHGRTEAGVRSQLLAAFKGLGKTHRSEIIVAYEPVWAVGTGRPVRPHEADRIHLFIQKVIHAPTRVIYGGSVDQKNIGEFLCQKHVSGVLIGGASTTYSSFAAIIRAAEAM